MEFPKVYSPKGFKKYETDKESPSVNHPNGSEAITVRVDRDIMKCASHIYPIGALRLMMVKACEQELMKLINLALATNHDFSVPPDWATGYIDKEGRRFEFVRDQKTNKVLRIIRKRNRQPKEID